MAGIKQQKMLAVVLFDRCLSTEDFIPKVSGEPGRQFSVRNDELNPNIKLLD